MLAKHEKRTIHAMDTGRSCNTLWTFNFVKQKPNSYWWFSNWIYYLNIKLNQILASELDIYATRWRDFIAFISFKLIWMCTWDFHSFKYDKRQLKHIPEFTLASCSRPYPEICSEIIFKKNTLNQNRTKYENWPRTSRLTTFDVQ